MKKRAMKKWIPKNTIYCKDCKWRRFLGTFKCHMNPPNEKGWVKCNVSSGCVPTDCWDGDEITKCRLHIYRCDYLGYTDAEQRSLLWDGCKECGVHYPKDFK